MHVIAVKNLLQEKVRFTVSIIGIAFAIMLMSLLLGIYKGMLDQFIEYLVQSPFNVVVAKEGVKDMYHSVTLINDQIAQDLENDDRVDEVTGVIMLRGFYEKDTKRQDVILFSYTPNKSIGAPWDLVEGENIKQPDEIVVGEGFARKNNLEIGDRIRIYNSDFKIVGLMKRSSNITAFYTFIHIDKSRELLQVPNTYYFIYVRLKDINDEKDFMREIEAKYPNTNAVPKEEFVEMNQAEIEETFLPIVYGIVIIGFLVGTSVIGLTTYTATLDKQKEYGVLKAIGMNNSQLYLLVIEQALITGVLGFVVGIVFSFVGRYLLGLFIFNMQINLDPSIFMLTSILSVFMILLSVYVPLRKITSIDPAEVFK